MGRGFVAFCQHRTSDQDMHQQPFQAFIAELGPTSAKNPAYPRLFGGWTNPFEKYAQIKLDHLPKDRSEIKKNIWNHHS